MDLLSELIEAHSARGNLDVRCQWSGDWSLPHPAEPLGVARLHIVVQGELHVGLGPQASLRAGTGDVLLLPQGQAHWLASDARAAAPPPQFAVQAHPLLQWRRGGEAAGLDLYCGRIDFDAGASVLLAALPPLLHLPASEGAAAVGALVPLMRAEVEQPGDGSRALLGQCSLALFALVLRHWWSRESVVHGVLGLLREPRLRPAAQALLMRYAEPWTVEALAADCHMSRASFLRLFDRASQTSPAALLSRLRMDAAALRLARGHDPVGQIALAVGFQSDSAFVRAFEREKGLSPSAYRRSRQRALGADD